MVELAAYIGVVSKVKDSFIDSTEKVMQSFDESLLKHPQCAALFVEYFEKKFSTERTESAKTRAETCSLTIRSVQFTSAAARY